MWQRAWLLVSEGKAAAAMATGRSELLSRVGRSKAGSSGGEGDDGATAAVSTAAATRDGRMGTAGWATAMEATVVAPSEATAPAATAASAVADLIHTTRQVVPQSPRHAADPARWCAERRDEIGDFSSIRLTDRLDGWLQRLSTAACVRGGRGVVCKGRSGGGGGGRDDRGREVSIGLGSFHQAPSAGEGRGSLLRWRWRRWSGGKGVGWEYCSYGGGG